ncbi:RNA polymerase II-associated protein 1 isoform X4 [Nematostella vectensis]|uniref:RNA polymerase II-associated protein 1 isoform X4 n=1 Tax=Nematostella vectensis TaxID=45351 RepID=UPI0013900C42|nr:RNA polymerase II-associated protein 1 isoform X4 [Nematostella vectensis]
MSSRPGKRDTEDDLLAFQEQFLADRQKPAALVVRVKRDEPSAAQENTKHDSSVATSVHQRDVVSMSGLPKMMPGLQPGQISPPRKRSKFKQQKEKQKQTKDSAAENLDAAELLERHDRHISTILSEIKERDVRKSNLFMPSVVLGGFPTALHRGTITKYTDNESAKNAKSLFAQQFKVAGPSEFGVLSQPQTAHQNTKYTYDGVPQGSFFGPSKLVTGEGLPRGQAQTSQDSEAVRIHHENVERLAGVSHEEIIAERERLMTSLDPALLAFLQSRTKQTTEPKLNQAIPEPDRVPSKTDKNPAMEDSEMRDDEDTIGTEVDRRDENKGSGAEEGAPEGRGEDKRCITPESRGRSESGPEKHVHFANDVSVVSVEGGVEQLESVRELVQQTAKQRWVHMDGLEPDKLEWMKDCPPPSAFDQKQGNQARFTFDGSLVTKEADLPVSLGLHHHGDDPGAAGYTLEELFILSRSSFLQQRVLALQTLSRIIAKENAGEFRDTLRSPPLPTLLDAGVLFLLRWALDDSTAAVMAAAIHGLAAVLVYPADEVSADQVCEWYCGLEVPALTPVESETARDKDEDRPLTDAELLKQDVIKGLVRMKLLPRLRYILEMCNPQPDTIICIFDILTRIARHSAESAYKVAMCPRLMEVTLGEFLTVDGLMLPNAMKMIRVVCTAGRHTAATMVSSHDVMGRVLRYLLAPLPTSVNMPLYLESMRTWTVLMSYGLASHEFLDAYPTMMQSLRDSARLCLLDHHSEPGSLLKRASAVLPLLEAAVHVAGTSADQYAKMTAGTEDAEPPAMPPVNWSHVTGLFPVIGCWLRKWVQELLSCSEVLGSPALQEPNLSLLSGTLNFLASFYTKLPSQRSYSPVETLEEMEDLVSSVLVPLSASSYMSAAIHELRQLQGPIDVTSRDIPSLPSYGPAPGLVSRGPAIAVMTSFVRLLCCVSHVHKGMAGKLLPFVERSDVCSYLKGFADSKVGPVGAFSRLDHHLVFLLIKLFSNVARALIGQNISSPLVTYHNAAMVLFARLTPGDEYYAHELMSSVLFDPMFYPESRELSSSSVTRELSGLTIKTDGLPTPPSSETSRGLPTPPSSETSRGPTTPPSSGTLSEAPDREELLCEAHGNLPSVRSMFFGSFSPMEHALAISRSRALRWPHDVTSLLLPASHGALVPVDWMFTPIVDLHNHIINSEQKGRALDEVPVSMVTLVKCTLQLLLLLEEKRPVSLTGVTMVARVARLMCIFMTGSDLFLHTTVHRYMSCLLHIYTQSHRIAQLDFSQPVPGLSSFYDLYSSLLTHFSAVSYGDSLFGKFVVLPLTQAQNSRYRLLLWEEHVGSLRSLSLSPCQVPVPLENFLYPIEQEEALLKLYLRALANQVVRPQWCPLFYLLAVHHLNAFIFQRVDPKDSLSLKRKLSLIQSVLLVKCEEVRHDLLYYYRPALKSPKAFELFSSLPADREMFLRSREDLESCKQLYATMATSTT